MYVVEIKHYSVVPDTSTCTLYTLYILMHHMYTAHTVPPLTEVQEYGTSRYVQIQYFSPPPSCATNVATSNGN